MNSAEFSRGIGLFNRREFYEAHEVLEDVWRAAPAESKKFYQGFVQAAVAFHHFSTGNRVGGRSVMERALRNLTGCPEDFHGVEVELFLGLLARWLEAVDQGHTLPPVPRIEVGRGT